VDGRLETTPCLFMISLTRIYDIDAYFIFRDSSVGMATGLEAGRPRDRGSISGSGKNDFCT
jgi:hypothetical protein